MFSRGITAMIALLAAAGVAITQPHDAKVTFYSDDVLRGALADIAKMPENELRAFTHYFAECQDDDADAASKHACKAARVTYEIEFGNKRALDDLIMAKAILDLAENLAFDASIKNAKQLADEAISYAKVVSALEHAAQDRFRSLKALNK